MQRMSYAWRDALMTNAWNITRLTCSITGTSVILGLDIELCGRVDIDCGYSETTPHWPTFTMEVHIGSIWKSSRSSLWSGRLCL